MITDLEIIVPVDKEIKVPVKYKYISDFRINNALKIEAIGGVESIDTYVEVLKSYINENFLVLITPIYFVTVKEVKTLNKVNDMVVDLYVGTLPSV